MNIPRSTRTGSQHADADIVDHIGNSSCPIYPLLAKAMILAVNGVPGCGKTTLIKLLNLLLEEAGITSFYLDTSDVISAHIKRKTPFGVQLAQVEKSLSHQGRLMPDRPTIGAIHDDACLLAGMINEPIQFAFFVGCPRNLKQIEMFDQLGYNSQLHLIHVMGTFEESVEGARQRASEGISRSDFGKERVRWNTWKHETLPGVQAFRRHRAARFLEVHRGEPIKSRLIDVIRMLGLPENTKNALCRKLHNPHHPVTRRIAEIENSSPKGVKLEKCFA